MNIEEKRKVFERLIGKTVVLVDAESETLGTLHDIGVADAYIETESGEDLKITLSDIKKVRWAEWKEKDLKITLSDIKKVRWAEWKETDLMTACARHGGEREE